MWKNADRRHQPSNDMSIKKNNKVLEIKRLIYSKIDFFFFTLFIKCYVVKENTKILD